MNRERLTPDRIRRLKLPAEAAQAFLWDTDAPRLAVRVTAGSKAFIFEALCRFLWNGRWFWQFEGAVMSRADVVRAQPNPLHRCPLAYAC
ncbi:MAG: hypothetical protein J0M14_16900, partial [Candidatus Accumulibacter sp.]|nr:hypothetical protein [Accumulibacter sp.]